MQSNIHQLSYDRKRLSCADTLCSRFTLIFLLHIVLHFWQHNPEALSGSTPFLAPHAKLHTKQEKRVCTAIAFWFSSFSLVTKWTTGRLNEMGNWAIFYNCCCDPLQFWYRFVLDFVTGSLMPASSTRLDAFSKLSCISYLDGVESNNNVHLEFLHVFGPQQIQNV